MGLGLGPSSPSRLAGGTLPMKRNEIEFLWGGLGGPQATQAARVFGRAIRVLRALGIAQSIPGPI